MRRLLMAHNPDQWCSAAQWYWGTSVAPGGRLPIETGGQINVVEGLYLILAINTDLKVAAAMSPTINRFQVDWGGSQLVVITY